MLQGLELSTAERDNAAAILEMHAARYAAAGTEERRRRCARSFVKPLNARRAALGRPSPLALPHREVGDRTFHEWLSPDTREDHLRPIGNSRRAVSGIDGWPLEWLEGTGVVCYERAAGRVSRERGGKPEAAFVQGLVKTGTLPTAVANSSDHYALVTREGASRYMSANEVARAFGVPEDSRLMRALTTPGTITPTQAVRCLGRSVHVGVARAIVRTLMARGTLTRGLSYGSAYSGVDTFAAALEAELGGAWTYAFASEPDRVPRAALLAAWGEMGLRREACHDDAAGEAAIREKGVDLWVCTPSCEAYSKRNHVRSHDRQRGELREVWACLGYARERRPKVIVLENVAETGSVGPITGLLARLPGYDVETGTLDPRWTAGEPIARERRFWVLTRREE